ncbi:MAG: phosphopantetheine-binding protein [Acidimicrobiales bacterium]
MATADVGRDISMDQDDLLVKCGGILGVDGLTPDDDFFGVGGNSLDAVEISEMLSQELNRDVDMETVLGSPTFADMLRALDQ